MQFNTSLKMRLFMTFTFMLTSLILSYGQYSTGIIVTFVVVAGVIGYAISIPLFPLKQPETYQKPLLQLNPEDEVEAYRRDLRTLEDEYYLGKIDQTTFKQKSDELKGKIAKLTNKPEDNPEIK